MMKDIPISKIYEAYSTIADGRIKKVNDTTFSVNSSDYLKNYTVLKDGKIYSSNDNATYWQKYAGYPIVAALLLEGTVSIDKEILPYFKGIPWKKLNKANRNHYDQSIEDAFIRVDKKTFEKIQEVMEKTKKEVMSLDLDIKGNKKKIYVPII